MPNRNLERCVSINDLRLLAQVRMPAPFFDLVDGGSCDEVTQRANEAAFEKIALVPHVARDVSTVSPKTMLLGMPMSFPLLLAPTGAQGMLHPDAEIASAKAAYKAGLPYCLSTFARSSIEAVAEACPGPKVFQLYALNDEHATSDMIERAKQAGYDALCLTVDSPTNSGLERVDRWGLNAAAGAPPFGTIFQIVKKPTWLWRNRTLFQNRLPDVAQRMAARGVEIGPDFFDMIIRSDLTWEGVAEIARRWDGPFMVKGILRPDDAVKAVDAGAHAVVVCNHGGTQLDGACAAIAAAEKVQHALDGQAKMLVAGGIRRGTAIMKALGLGADAVMVGRPFLYGLAAAGEEGVARSIEMLQREFVKAMMLSGVDAVNQIAFSDLIER